MTPPRDPPVSLAALSEQWQALIDEHVADGERGRAHEVGNCKRELDACRGSLGSALQELEKELQLAVDTFGTHDDGLTGFVQLRLVKQWLEKLAEARTRIGA